MTKLEDMLDMKLNQEVESECFRIKRVPGGWIYARALPGCGMTSTFVAEPK